MASGLLGKTALIAGQNIDLYTVPAGIVATANINLCNRTSASVRVRVAVRIGTLSDQDYIEYDALVPPGGALERTGVALSAGETITCRADANGISARVHGFEEAA